LENEPASMTRTNASIAARRSIASSSRDRESPFPGRNNR
jgi:hypothetical protein